MKTIDTSYSGITSVIQKDLEKGCKALLDFAAEIRDKKRQLEALEKELRNLERNIGMYEQAVKHIFKHLELQLPQAIHKDNKVYVFRENNGIEILELIGSIPPAKAETA